jgi:hypothetical protein
MTPRDVDAMTDVEVEAFERLFKREQREQRRARRR